MKRTFKLFSMLMIMTLLFVIPYVLAQSDAGETVNSVAEQIWMWLGAILAIYEIAARMIPTLNDITVLGYVINILKAISDFLNRGLDEDNKKIT